MSVLEREMYNEVDEYGVSHIINDFMDIISKNPDKEYEIPYSYFNEAIIIKYKPTHNTLVNGETRRRYIYIYTHYTPKQHLNIKYTLAHELVHMTHQILSNNERPFEDLDDIGKIRHILIKQNINNINSKLNYISYIMYMEDKNETLAKNQNAYIWSFRYKQENPTCSSGDVVGHVLSKLKVDDAHFKLSLHELKYSDSFDFILILLVGHFHEFGKTGIIRYFDKHIYYIPFIKKMRNELQQIMSSNEFTDRKLNGVKELIYKYKDDFYNHKDEILKSFIHNFKDNFNDMKKRIGKSIQLGLDDASELINKG
ncbi:MAG: hypothetical protein NC548_27475 [Lachnospiraceae bacterium]|nr:hypothetical protein [Lachnospiraceae bacterium]